MKRRLLLLLLLGVFLSVACSTESIKIKIENTLEFDRNGEMVEISTVDLKADFTHKTYLLKDEKGVETGYQLLKNSKVPVLIFQANVPAQSSATYTLVEGTPANVAIRTQARLVPERRDDFAWENDIAAFRMYGPALEEIENPSNGVDIWVKYKDEPVMDAIYEGTLRKLSYHEDNALGGFDSYDVGHTLGAGGNALYTNRLWLGDAFDSYEILESGPLRSVFTLIYDTIRMNDMYYAETLTITTDAGSMLNKGVVNYQGLEQPVQLATGIFMHRDSANVFYDKENRVLSYTKNITTNKGLSQGQHYIGIYVPEASSEPFIEDNQYILLSDYKMGNDFTYYFGGAWSQWKFPTEQGWCDALIRFSQAKKEPLKIKVLE
ncbi:MAG: DUF4861 domain-containing protein [Dysgonamonadaceae bacterium]|jgi:hypothetical protein|nr:DUF4861 domain-containing protein [Dysgonamonadaceae bacterium]